MSVTLVVKVDSSLISNHSNPASPTPHSFPTRRSSDLATELTTVNTSANLALTKSDSPDPVLAGTNITYTLTVTNNGPSDATGVRLGEAHASATVTDASRMRATVTTGIVGSNLASLRSGSAEPV